MINTLITKLSEITKSLAPSLKRYKYLIGGVLVLAVFSFVIFRIDSLSSPGMNQEKYDLGILEIKKVKFDAEAIETINSLNPTDIEVTENIDESRNNPF